MRTIFLKIFSFISLISFSIPTFASAHVRFIANDMEVARYSGYDWVSFFSPLLDPINILLIVITILVVALISLLVPLYPAITKYGCHLAKNLSSYKEYLPGLIRLIVAISLIGSGTAMHFLSPVLPANETLAFIQIFIGFMLFIGFLIEPLVLAAIILFFFGLWQDMYLIGSLDLLAMLIVLLAIDAERPGIDDVFDIRDHIHLNFFRKYVPLILRLGIGISMMFLALYEKVFNPHLAEFVVNVTDLTNVIPVSPQMWVFGAGIIEFAIGLLLVVGFRTRIVSVIAFIVLSLSFFYFGEDVTSHITLFGILGAILITGAGSISLDEALIQKKICDAGKPAARLIPPSKKKSKSKTKKTTKKAVKKVAKKVVNTKTTKATKTKKQSKKPAGKITVRKAATKIQKTAANRKSAPKKK